MAKKETIGKCALCGRDNMVLKQSHIIPKLIYNRTKTYENSRFRNFTNLNQIYQDGEKKALLCHDCEEHFSKYETEFSNKFLDKYLNQDSLVLPKQYDGIHNYILTVAWRMLYDDLFVLNSFDDTHMRNTYEYLEKRLRKYLNQIRTDNVDVVTPSPVFERPQCFGEMIASYEEKQFIATPESLQNIETYIFTLKDLGFNENIIKFLDPFIWGYSCNSGDQKIYAVYSAYKGLLIATVYWNNKVLLMSDKIKDMLKFRKSRKKLKNFLISEVNYELQQIATQYPNYQEFLSKNKEKLENRYKNSPKLR